mgnify:FL=1
MAVISNGNKDRLRKDALFKRSLIKNSVVENNSRLITENLFKNFDFTELNTHLFYPISKNKEVNTWEIHEELKEKNKIYTSIYLEETKAWSCSSFDPKTEFEIGKFSIPFPLTYKKAKYLDLEIIMVPLLIFDLNGHRIGYGKGIYDDILSKLNKNCIKIGLSLLEFSEEKIEFEPHDIGLDYCQTPTTLHDFKLNP